MVLNILQNSSDPLRKRVCVIFNNAASTIVIKQYSHIYNNVFLDAMDVFLYNGVGYKVPNIIARKKMY